jgi:ApaG protein
MEGSYILQDESGQRFEAPIAPFTLAVPNIIN